ncbi:MAG TPA: DUF1269 domain-containing protein [Steroidobacteraceae bacterium]|nr:DUF1269 domain-containing protein [Steroidobacteraceae bacterium]
MDKMLAVVFDSETAAYEGAKALTALDAEGSISIYAQAVIKKNVDGTVSTKRVDEFPIRTFSGTAIGSLIGLLGGPVGLGVGAAVGALSGLIGDVYASDLDADFVAEVSQALTPGKCAVVADMTEEWVTPVDSRMEAIGGVVFRTLRKTVKEDRSDREAASLRAEIDQLKAEHAKAAADRKIKLQAKIDSLNARREKKLEQSRARSEQAKRELEAKVEALQKKAAKEKGDLKAALDARIAHLREDYSHRQHT